MRLSPLQKYILRSCYGNGQPKINRVSFPRFYDSHKQKPTKGDIVNIITKSLESLIDKELMVGYGVRTPHKWYIKEVKLMPKGRRLARQLLGQQQSLPFLKKSKSKNQTAK
jgi:hypothetical protein